MATLISLAAFMAALSVVNIGVACVTGSTAAVVYGLIDAVIGLVAFCVWAWSL